MTKMKAIKQIAARIDLRNPGIAAASRVESPCQDCDTCTGETGEATPSRCVVGTAELGGSGDVGDRCPGRSRVGALEFELKVGELACRKCSALSHVQMRNPRCNARCRSEGTRSYRKQNRRHGPRFGPIQSPAGRRWLTETKEIRQAVIEGAEHRFCARNEDCACHRWREAHRRIYSRFGGAAHVACCLPLVSCYFLTSLLEQELSFISRTAQAIVCPRNSQFATRTRNGQ
jgi:hypothetical protein